MTSSDQTTDQTTQREMTSGYAADELDVIPEVPEVGSWSRLSSIKSFWTVAAAMGAIMLALIPVVHNGYIALPDEAVYMAQAKALSEGSWSIERPAPDFDRMGNFDPLGSTEIVESRRIPYHRHPLYSLTLTPAYKIGGVWGLFTMSAVAGWAAAVTSALIARCIDERFGIPTMILIGLGSPLLFSAYLVVAQPIAATLSAALILSSFAIIFRTRRWAYLPLGLAAMLLPCYRSEGAVFTGVAAFALIATGLGVLRHDGRQRLYAVTTGLIVGTMGIVGYLADIAVTRTIAEYGDSFYTNPSKAIGGEQTSFVNAAWIGLFKPWKDAVSVTPWLPIVIICVILGAITMRLHVGTGLLPLGLLGTAGLSSITFAITNKDLVPGLFATMPVLFFALLWSRKKQAGNPQVLLLYLISFGCAVALVATIYGDGGSGQWGGRLFQIMLPALVPLSVVGIHNALDSVERRHRMIAIACLVTVSSSLSFVALKQNNAMRDRSRMTNLMILELVNHVRVTEKLNRSDLLVFFSQQPTTGAARALWENDVKLNLLSVGFKNLYAVLTEDDFGPYRAVLVISDVPATAFTVLNRSLLSEHGMRVRDFTSDRPTIADGTLYTNLPRHGQG